MDEFKGNKDIRACKGGCSGGGEIGELKEYWKNDSGIGILFLQIEI